MLTNFCLFMLEDVAFQFLKDPTGLSSRVRKLILNRLSRNITRSAWIRQAAFIES